MSAFSLLSSGDFGSEVYEEFVRQLRSVVRRAGYPAPPGSGAWTRDASRDWLHDFFVKKGPEVATKLLVLATDESSFERLIRKAIENELKDQAKATTVGKLRSRMRTLLARVDGFVDATELFAGAQAWSVENAGDAIYTGDWRELLNLPQLRTIVPIQVLNSAGPTSRENAKKLIDAARVILEGARGAMRDQDLAAALVQLFELEQLEVFFVADYDDNAAGDVAPDERVAAIEEADRIISLLSQDEGRALVALGEPSAVAAELLPHIPDVQQFMLDLREKMRTIVQQDTLPVGTLDIVMHWFSAPSTGR